MGRRRGRIAWEEAMKNICRKKEEENRETLL